jgi:hypothetical protein
MRTANTAYLLHLITVIIFGEPVASWGIISLHESRYTEENYKEPESKEITIRPRFK